MSYGIGKFPREGPRAPNNPREQSPLPTLKTLHRMLHERNKLLPPLATESLFRFSTVAAWLYLNKYKMSIGPWKQY